MGSSANQLPNSQDHLAFHPIFAQNYTLEDLHQSLIGPEFHRITLDSKILEILKEIIPYSLKYNFTSNKSLNSFFNILRQTKGKRYGLLQQTNKPTLIAHYRHLLSENQIPRNYQLEKYLRRCGARSWSGVISVTIFTSGELLGQNDTKTNLNTIKTGGCPMDCHYCPFEKDENGIATQPRSYLSTEPGNRRATENKHHPIGQVYDRLRQLEQTGHLPNNPEETSKIEAIISGATFPFYPINYLEWFTQCMFYAYNTYYQQKPNQPPIRQIFSLEEEKRINETSSLRVIGLTIETRPDYVTPKSKDPNHPVDFSQIKLFRRLGVTRVQIGVQSTKDYLLKKVNRKCTNHQNKLGLRRLKQNGFKADIHIMLDLPGSSPQIDKEVIDEIVDDPDYQADQWKIYPTEVTPFTKIKEWYEAGTYQPYAEDHTHGTSYKLIDVMAYALQRVPEYIRINRVVRDFPTESIEGGLCYTNARQLVDAQLRRNNQTCRDIRNREVKHSAPNLAELQLNIMSYPSSGGTEYFISYTNRDQSELYGFVRLRHNQDYTDVLPSLHGCALIRELHVYGTHTSLGQRSANSGQTQHLGLGSKLLQKAEEISTRANFKRIAVISGVGVRNYYRKKGYLLGQDEYMFKNLSLLQSWFIKYLGILIGLFLIIVSFLNFY